MLFCQKVNFTFSLNSKLLEFATMLTGYEREILKLTLSRLSKFGGVLFYWNSNTERLERVRHLWHIVALSVVALALTVANTAVCIRHMSIATAQTKGRFRK